jgi:hypothetical protein
MGPSYEESAQICNKGRDDRKSDRGRSVPVQRARASDVEGFIKRIHGAIEDVPAARYGAKPQAVHKILFLRPEKVIRVSAFGRNDAVSMQERLLLLMDQDSSPYKNAFSQSETTPLEDSHPGNVSIIYQTPTDHRPLGGTSSCTTGTPQHGILYAMPVSGMHTIENRSKDLDK